MKNQDLISLYRNIHWLLQIGLYNEDSYTTYHEDWHNYTSFPWLLRTHCFRPNLELKMHANLHPLRLRLRFCFKLRLSLRNQANRYSTSFGLFSFQVVSIFVIKYLASSY